MEAVDPQPRRAFAVVALALGGLALALTPAAERVDAWCLDHAWRLAGALGARTTTDAIVVVGVDDESVRRAPELLGAGHEVLGDALSRIASAHPRAIGLDLPLPERSFEAVRAGLDRALAAGLAAARANGPLVAAVVIDTRTRSAKPVYEPYLAIIGADSLALDLLGRDADGTVRRFALGIPTQDGGFPTLVGRLCEALRRACSEGLIDFALGPALGYVSFGQVREARDARALEGWFQGRIVLIGSVRGDADRVAVPASPARWERSGREAPAVAVHAQALRTALSGYAPRPLSRPAVALLVASVALVGAVRRPKARLVVAAVALAALFAAAVLALRSGVFVPVAAPAAVLAAVMGLTAARSRAAAVP